MSVDVLAVAWNYKAALFSSLFRATIFFFANVSAGREAATGAAMAEFAYRAISAGFYGGITQRFRRVEPAWKGLAGALILVPAITHTIEFLIHSLRGTPNLKASIVASICFTVLSTTFNLYAMRRGVMVSGPEGLHLATDMKAIPGVVAGFVAAGPLALARVVSRIRS